MRSLIVFLFIISLFFTGCGDNESTIEDTPVIKQTPLNTLSSSQPITATFIDGKVSGLSVVSYRFKNVTTNENGEFPYTYDAITFKLGDISLGTLKDRRYILNTILLSDLEGDDEKIANMAYVLQNLDTDANATDAVIHLPNPKIMKKVLDTTPLDFNDRSDVINQLPIIKEAVKSELNISKLANVTIDEAIANMNRSAIVQGHAFTQQYLQNKTFYTLLANNGTDGLAMKLYPAVFDANSMMSWIESYENEYSITAYHNIVIESPFKQLDYITLTIVDILSNALVLPVDTNNIRRGMVYWFFNKQDADEIINRYNNPPIYSEDELSKMVNGKTFYYVNVNRFNSDNKVESIFFNGLSSVTMTRNGGSESASLPIHYYRRTGNISLPRGSLTIVGSNEKGLIALADIDERFPVEHIGFVQLYNSRDDAMALYENLAKVFPGR